MTGTSYPLPTSFDPSAIPTAYPSQWPFANPYAALNITSSPALTPLPSSSASASTLAEGAEGSGTTTRPNAAIIAVPISICGAILLASLLLCARSRMKKPKDLESGPVPSVPATGAGAGAGPGNAGVPTDWQAMVKRKALDGMGTEKGHDGGNITITERRDDAILPILGYIPGSHSSLPPAYRARRGAPMVERYVDDPYTRFDGLHTRRQGFSRDIYSRGSRDRDREREREREKERAVRYMGDRSAYSSRSGSGSGSRCITPCARDRSHDTHGSRHSDHSRHSHHSSRAAHSRGSKGRYDEYDHPPRHSHSNWEKEDYYTPSRRSRSGLGGVRDTCDCPPYPPSRHPHPHSHAHTHSHSHSGNCTGCSRQISINSSGRTRPRTPDDPDPNPMRHLPGPTYSSSSSSSRPLPEPMIRSDSQTHSSDMSSRHSRDYLPKSKTNSKLHSHPHRTGVLRRADSSTSTDTDAGWDLAGKGAYETSHGRGMGELYESLRRAIGESEPGLNHVRA